MNKLSKKKKNDEQPMPNAREVMLKVIREHRDSGKIDPTSIMFI